MRQLWVISVVAGCYAPSLPAGAPCASTAACPAPLVCEANVCVRPGTQDAATTCSCTGSTLACAAQSQACTLGCTEDGGTARCLELEPSNAVSVSPIAQVSTEIQIMDGSATFDTATGQITGVITRPAGDGVASGIHFATIGQEGPGVFTVHALTVEASGTIRLVGVRPSVIVAGTTIVVTGTIDGSAGCDSNSDDLTCPGPGGGSGATSGSPATGCAPGSPGTSGAPELPDAGGAGGGGGTMGGAGGPAGVGTTPGPPTIACLAATLEPLAGGSGGGLGGFGAGDPTLAAGGGGGGALQLTALASITIAGTLRMSGAGGRGGPREVMMNMGGAGAGAGGGAGGGILLEAPDLVVSGALAANGGGGGGGGAFTTVGGNGQLGTATATPAMGGTSPAMNGQGGAGAAGASDAQPGAAVNGTNGGGGGGGGGRIFLRTRAGTPPTLTGSISPAAGTGDVRTR